MREVDINTIDDRSFEENVVGLLRAYPTSIVVLLADGPSFRAALIDRPIGYVEPSSHCRPSIPEAIAHLHHKFVAEAAASCSRANEHLSKLMTRVLPKETSPRQSEEKSK